MESNIKFFTNVKIRRFDLAGNHLEDIEAHNLVVSTGCDMMRNLLLSSYTSTEKLVPYRFMLGTGSTPAYSTDTALQSSAYNIAFTETTIRTGGVTFNGSVYSTDGVGSTWNEVGIFTSSSQMWARALIAPLIKTSSNPTNELIGWAFDFIPST